MYVLIDQTERPALVNQTRVTEVTVRSEVAPIGQVELVWGTDSGLITHAKSYTDDRGEARATFMGANVGDVTIGVTAIKAGFPVATTKVEISVVSAPKSTSDQPSFFGVPVRVLFALALLSLIGFMVLRVRHALGMRLGKILR